MTWKYDDEESLLQHIRKLQEKHEKEFLEEMEGAFTDHEVEDEDEDEEYDMYVKYIAVYRSTRMEHDFETLEIKVNKFIEKQRDSFILEGPIQIEKNYLVQTLINEDEM